MARTKKGELEKLEIIKDFKYINEDGHYVLTKEQLYKIIMKTKQEKTGEKK